MGYKTWNYFLNYFSFGVQDWFQTHFSLKNFYISKLLYISFFVKIKHSRMWTISTWKFQTSSYFFGWFPMGLPRPCRSSQSGQFYTILFRRRPGTGKQSFSYIILYQWPLFMFCGLPTPWINLSFKLSHKTSHISCG